jgi:adenosylhomocysteine nucleosidase
VSAASDIRPVLIVTGAAFEARIAEGAGVVAVCAGGDPSRLKALLDELDPGHFRAVISFGLAGGLDPALRPGDVVIADQIISGERTWRANPALAGALQSALSAGGAKPSHSSIAGVDATVMDPASKAALRTATGAAAVDMESHVAAAYATSRNLPWASLRAICDPAMRALPPLATRGLKPDGRIDFAVTLTSLARDPSQIPALIRTGLDSAIAIAALRRARRLLDFGLGLGRADLG